LNLFVLRYGLDEFFVFIPSVLVVLLLEQRFRLGEEGMSGLSEEERGKNEESEKKVWKYGSMGVMERGRMGNFD
tara:strand:+ start:178 stop:399 length:222 start_codon:yes stop_codon:yes gene_type:complete